MPDLTKPTHTNYGVRVEITNDLVMLSLISLSQTFTEYLTRADAKRVAYALLLAADGIE